MNSLRVIGAVIFFYLAIVVVMDGCNGDGSAYTPSNTSFYESDEFQNADRKVQEDVIIYDILKQQGFSDQESKDAVINSMNQ